MIAESAGFSRGEFVNMEDWHGQNFVDFHLLRKDSDGWKIIAKVFTENAAGSPLL